MYLLAVPPAPSLRRLPALAAGLPARAALLLARAALLLALTALLLVVAAPAAYAQEADSTAADSTATDSTAADSTAADSTAAAATDSLRTPKPPAGALGLPADSLPGRRDAGPLGGPPSGAASSRRQAGGGGGDGDALKAPVTLTARDSLVLTSAPDAGDVGTAYGEAKMTYEDATLTAHAIDIAFDASELRARPDTSGPETTGYPRFKQGQEAAFDGQTLAYNLGTQRGRVVTARTEIDAQGNVRGRVVKVLEDSTLFVADGLYTTCDCEPDETPSYSLRSDRMKIARDEWVYTGPLQLYIFNVPTPLWLPFGFLPATDRRRSGPLPPQYGEDPRGFYLRDWGWYFALNDYTDLQVRGSVWSGGSFQVEPFFRYAKRYGYSGNLRVNYLRNRRGEATDPDFAIEQEGSLTWTHSQTLNPTTTLGGNVNLVTSSNYLRTTSQNFDDIVRGQIGSSVSFAKRWPAGGRRLSLNLAHQQAFPSVGAGGAVQPETVNLTLPSLDFSQNNLQPFARAEGAPGPERWYERITTSYSGSVENRYAFRPLAPQDLAGRPDSAAVAARIDAVQWYEALFSQEQYRLATGRDERFDFEAAHRVPVTASYRINRFNLNVSPTLNTSSTWFIRTTRLRSVLDTTFVQDDATGVGVAEPVVTRRRAEASVPGFFARNRFDVGVSTNTTFYGTFPLKAGPLEGLRHTVRPDLGLSYQPDFNRAFWGETRTFADTDSTIARYSIVTGNLVQGSTERRALTFGVANEFETKRVRTDSTGQRQERRLKLLDVRANSSYNFVADSLKLADIRVAARTNAIPQVGLTTNFTFSPYAFVTDTTGRGIVVDRLLLANSPLTPVRLTNLRISANTSLQGGQQGAKVRPADRPDAGSTLDPGGQILDQGYGTTNLGYADFSIPWSVNLGFTYSYRRPTNDLTRSAILNTGFDFNVTPLWKVQAQSGYDFIERRLTTTSLTVLRDLGCWQMSFNWNPFGRFQSYGFRLQVKSGQLREILRLNLPRNERGGFFDRVGSTAAGAAGGVGG